MTSSDYGGPQVPDLDAVLGAASEDVEHPAVEDATRRLLGGPLDLDQRALARRAGLSGRSVARIWHALGFPEVDADEPAYAEADLAAVEAIAGLVRSGIADERLALELTRACARTTDRLAAWHTSLLGEALSPWQQGEVSLSRADLVDGHDSTRAEPDEQTALLVADEVARLADALEPILVYAWRRHLASSVARTVADAQPAVGRPGTRVRGVGFADLVSFTSLTRRLSERELAVVVQRFEGLATDVVTTRGGRVVKTVGDEVMFVAKEAGAVAGIGLDLLHAIESDELLPSVRVGMAYGPIVSRLGDVFGTTVNTAARLAAVAPSGRVLVDEALAGAVAGLPGLQTVAQRTRTLRGVGVVVPSLLQRARPVDPVTPAPSGPDPTPHPHPGDTR